MVKQRYNIDDLLTQLREQHIRSIEEVDYAVLETSGNLSVFQKHGELSSEYPMPIILDGEIQKEIEKDEKWVLRTLRNQHMDLEDVFYAFYRKKELFIIRNENTSK